MAGLMGLDWHQQKELLRLRARLSFRQFMGEKAKLLTAVTIILILFPLMIGLAIATGIGYFALPDQWPTQLLGFVLVLSWIIWSIAPLLSFNVNQGLDPTRLLIYPITQRDFLAHLLLGTLLDYPTYFLAPFVLAIIIGFGLGWSLPIVLMAVFLCYLLMVLTSQTLLNVLGGVLNSRRFRDISLIIGAMFGMSCFFISQGMQNFIRQLNVGEEEIGAFLRGWEPLEVMKWLPPGAAAKAIEQATFGAWGMAMLWLGYTFIWVMLIAALWWRVTHRLVTGEGFVLGKPETAVKHNNGKSKVQKQVGNGRLGIIRYIPIDIRLIAIKELKLRWRTPQSRIGIIYMYLMPFFFAGLPLIAGDPEVEPFVFQERTVVIGISLYTIFLYWVNGQNMLGWEAAGLPMLFLTPIPRQRLFLGKILAQLLMNGVPILIMTIGAMILRPSLTLAAMLPISFALGLACLSITMLFSVLFPYPVNIEGQSGQNPFASGGGCLTGLANSMFMPMLISLICVPILAPLALVLWQEWGWLAVLVVPVALVYGGGLSWLAIKFVSQRVVEQEPEILLATKPTDKGDK